MSKFATRMFIDVKKVFDLVLDRAKDVKEFIIFLILVSSNVDTPKNQFTSSVVEKEHFLTQSTTVSIVNHNSLF